MLLETCYACLFISLCVVLALNSQAIQSKACIFAANYKCSTIFLETVEIIFAANKMKHKRTDGESAKAAKEGTSVRFKIQI